MPFSGGGGGDLPNHQHSNVPLSGGPLDMANVTIGSLSAGSVVYSDGNALQELVAPGVPAGETLTFAPAATAPSWASGAAGGTLELLYQERLTVAGGFTYTPGSALLNTDYSTVRVVTTYAPSVTGDELQMRVNGVGTGYHVDGSAIQGGVQTFYDLNNQGQWNIGYDGEANRSSACTTDLFMADASYTGTKSLIGITSNTSGGNPFYQAGLQMNGTHTSISEIEVYASSGSLQIGSQIAIYGAKRT